MEETELNNYVIRPPNLLEQQVPPMDMNGGVEELNTSYLAPI